MPSRVETSQESLDRLRSELDVLRVSRERLAVAHDAERRSLERELHDGLQQHLVALAVNHQLARELVDADPGAARKLLDAIGRDLQLALAEAGRLAIRVYPPLLEAGGLRASIRAAAASAGVRARIDVETELRYPPEVAGAIYFCCLGVLEGVGEGADASIDVRVDGDTVLFEIAEHGGEELDDTAGSARDRVEALGGRLTVESEPGGGSRIAGSLPLGR